MKLKILLYKKKDIYGELFKMIIAYQHSNTFHPCPQRKRRTPSNIINEDDFYLYSISSPQVGTTIFYMYGEDRILYSPYYFKKHEFDKFKPLLKEYFGSLPEETTEMYEHVIKHHFNNQKIKKSKEILKREGYKYHSQIKVE